MKRQQLFKILEDLKKKMVVVIGPRQAGKTWLSRNIMSYYKTPLYLNYDNYEDKNIIDEQSWLSGHDLIVFDELHKKRDWKTYIKGVYDKKRANQHLLITGSARLDTFRKMGDALTGRFYKHRLLPFSVQELSKMDAKIKFKHLFEQGGFPEPLLANCNSDAMRWRQDYLDSLIREEILDFDNITQLSVMNKLIRLLRQRVGSPISHASLARDLSSSVPTINKYIEILEALFIVFKVTPYSKNISRSILKEPKIYFYDWALVDAEDAIKYENMIAVHLLKHCHGLRDQQGLPYELQYMRTKEHKEIDFCIVNDLSLETLIEAKYRNRTLSKDLLYFSEKYKIPAVQVLFDLDARPDRIKGPVQIVSAKKYLKSLFL